MIRYFYRVDAAVQVGRADWDPAYTFYVEHGGTLRLDTADESEAHIADSLAASAPRNGWVEVDAAGDPVMNDAEPEEAVQADAAGDEDGEPPAGDSASVHSD